MLDRFLSSFDNAWPEIKQLENEWEKFAAPYFNIFRVLRLQRHETKLHSRFLAELLDPRGSHGQSDYFLRTFLELGKKDGLCYPTEWSSGLPAVLDWKITTEEGIGNWGRLDIVIRCARKFVMVIENKVDAGEGTEQLLRYHKWLDEQQADFRNLVFLTPNLRIPETIFQDKCIRLTYCKHIDDWLREAAREIQAPQLRFALDQYLQVVESL